MGKKISNIIYNFQFVSIINLSIIFSLIIENKSIILFATIKVKISKITKYLQEYFSLFFYHITG